MGILIEKLRRILERLGEHNRILRFADFFSKGRAEVSLKNIEINRDAWNIEGYKEIFWIFVERFLGKSGNFRIYFKSIFGFILGGETCDVFLCCATIVVLLNILCPW